MMPYSFATRDLSVQFGDFTALQEVSFTVPDKAFLAIVGPNGAGKSTLMRVLLGLVQPTQGRVEVLGDVPKRHPESVGYVPQIKTFNRSFPAEAIELVLSGLRGSWTSLSRPHERQVALAALEQVGALNLAKRQLGRLSGGELQRVYLARALVRKPKLILLDEPATGIDVLGEKDMYALLDQYRKGQPCCIAMITHDFDVARYHADAVLLLNRQKIACGTPKEVLNEANIARAYGHLNHQHRRL